MQTTVRVLNILMRICGGAALALGLAFWLGYARPWTYVHVWLGIGVVVSLWALAGLALGSTRRRGLALFAIAWGLITWVVGLSQSRILPGSSHWLIALVHLLIGVVAIGLGARLAGAAQMQGATQRGR